MAGNQFYLKFEKYKDLTLLTTKEKLEEAKRELEPYLSKPSEVGAGKGIYYFVDKEFAEDPNFLTKIGASYSMPAGNKYVFDRDERMKSLECYLKAIDIKLQKIGGDGPSSNKTQLKFTGCRCEYRVNGEREKTFEADLKGETYDENKDLVACPQCQNQDKYKNFIKKHFDGNEVRNQRHQMSITIIKDAKIEEEPTAEKCADCQQEKKPNELITIRDQGKDIKVCSECKQKRDNPNDSPNRKPNNPNPDNVKKWGDDFGKLKPGQRQDRIKVNNSWNEKRSKIISSLVCCYCQKKFDYNKSIEDYLPARKEVEGRLDTHKSSCPLKNKKSEQKRLAQEEWDKERKSKIRVFYRCKDGCWGKIVWDKSIEDAEQAKKQASADLKYHKKHECGKEGKRKIAVYFSPNKGGNEHANINDFTYEDIDNLALEGDNEGEVYQQQGNDKPRKIWPWVVGIGGIFAVVAIVLLIVRNKKRHGRRN